NGSTRSATRSLTSRTTPTGTSTTDSATDRARFAREEEAWTAPLAVALVLVDFDLVLLLWVGIWEPFGEISGVGRFASVANIRSERTDVCKRGPARSYRQARTVAREFSPAASATG